MSDWLAFPQPFYASTDFPDVPYDNDGEAVPMTVLGYCPETLEFVGMYFHPTTATGRLYRFKRAVLLHQEMPDLVDRRTIAARHRS